jgi:hypothetical protein
MGLLARAFRSIRLRAQNIANRMFGEGMAAAASRGPKRLQYQRHIRNPKYLIRIIDIMELNSPTRNIGADRRSTRPAAMADPPAGKANTARFQAMRNPAAWLMDCV